MVACVHFVGGSASHTSNPCLTSPRISLGLWRERAGELAQQSSWGSWRRNRQGSSRFIGFSRHPTPVTACAFPLSPWKSRLLFSPDPLSILSSHHPFRNSSSTMWRLLSHFLPVLGCIRTWLSRDMKLASGLFTPSSNLFSASPILVLLNAHSLFL